jgi:hypothetical protein
MTLMQTHNHADDSLLSLVAVEAAHRFSPASKACRPKLTAERVAAAVAVSGNLSGE